MGFFDVEIDSGLNEVVKYKEIKPSGILEPFVHSFWMHQNFTEEPEVLTILPDSFFKIVFLVRNKKVINYFITGLWTTEKEFITPPNTTNIGCRLKILAPEYLIGKEMAYLINSLEHLDKSYLGIGNFQLTDFRSVVSQWEFELTKKISSKEILPHKLRLSKLLYEVKGNISASEVSTQIFWTNRQINRYLNKYLGISLKTYLNIQKCYELYTDIRQGRLYPDKDYFDQAHLIKEVRKHTGHSPGLLYRGKNDRFIQLKHIRTK